MSGTSVERGAKTMFNESVEKATKFDQKSHVIEQSKVKKKSLIFGGN